MTKNTAHFIIGVVISLGTGLKTEGRELVSSSHERLLHHQAPAE